MRRSSMLCPVDKQRTPVFGGNNIFFGVARQAIVVRHTLVVKNPACLMRLVAIDAHGNGLGLLLPKLTLDDLAVHLFDLGMAREATANDVPARDRRARVRMREDLVRAVTGGARGGHVQSLL